MAFFRRAVWLGMFSVLTACGGAPPSAGGQDDLVSSRSAATSVTFDGCLIIITTVSSGTPPSYRIILRRQVIEYCHLLPYEINLDTSVNYNPSPSLSLVANDLGVAATYVKKQSVSGSAPSTLGVSHIDPVTMNVVRQTGLAVSLGAGNINSGTPFIDADGTTLIVSGTKTGRISGESGSGNNYIATFPHFFTSTTPGTVLAF